MWKRKQAIIVWEWDLQNIEEDEEQRPEFESNAKTFRTNPVTKEREPYIPTWTKIYRYFVTASVVTMMVRTSFFFLHKLHISQTMSMIVLLIDVNFFCLRNLPFILDSGCTGCCTGNNHLSHFGCVGCL